MNLTFSKLPKRQRRNIHLYTSYEGLEVSSGKRKGKFSNMRAIKQANVLPRAFIIVCLSKVMKLKTIQERIQKLRVFPFICNPALELFV
mmetsp:Transcript_14494/g.20263  ORF Transcript_14494/g.20263 Transcript_14494/m.20263 type:complete len:89 (+) Transcript_14494:380-646(+)